VANLITYISVLNPEFSSTNGSTTSIIQGVGTFGYVHFLNIQPPSTGGGGTMSLVGSQNVTIVQAGSTATVQGPDLTPYLTTAAPPGAYLTTAAQSDHSHGSLALALTNLDATVSSANTGLYLSLSARSGLALAAGGSTGGSNGTVQFSNANGVSFGLSGSTMTASAVAGTINQTGPNIAVPGTTVTGGDVVFSNSNGVSFGINGSTITARAEFLLPFVGTAWTVFGGSVTANSSGGTINLPAYLTTYSHVAAARSQAWDELGVHVGTTSPGPGVVYSDWLAGSSGYWMWVRIP
jgi:hypothetical protein